MELLDVVVSPDEFDYDCGPISATMSPEQMAGEQARVLSLAEDLGADTVTTISHACQREWCGCSSQDVGIRNYITIVAEAMGLDVASDWLREFKHVDDPEQVVDMGRTAWSSYGLTREEALLMASKYFGQDRLMSP